MIPRASSRTLRPIFLLIWCWLYSTRIAAAEDNLYQILGVQKTASIKEIKRAYRRKALDTHPDKNTGVDPEEAAEAFRKVVHAFEILSDESTRRFYDKTGRTDRKPGVHTHQRSAQRTYTYYKRRSQRLKDKPDVRNAQARILHVVSLEQLKTIMLDDDGKLERNLLMCFVIPGKIQQVAEDNIVFPYPFAGMSKQKIWWEDLLQTVQVRFHRSNDLSKFFGIPHTDEMKEPMFLFGKRGQRLSDPFTKLSTSDRQSFENWTWQQIQVVVEFHNRHTHPVEVYWITGTSARLQATLEADHRSTMTTMLSHEFFIRDARVDTRPDSLNRNRLTPNTKIASWKIVDDTHMQNLTILPKACYDLSGHCPSWYRRGECKKNPQFMTQYCKKTCKLCTDADDDVLRATKMHDEL